MSALPARLLIVDDDHAFRVSTAALLRQEGHEVEAVGDGAEAVEALRQRRFDLMLLDLRLPGLDGLQIVEALRLWGEAIPILMISGFGTVDAAVRALHHGADDFLTKPVEPDVLATRVAELLERRPGAEVVPSSTFAGLVGRSAAMQEVFDAIRRVAPTEATVLVTGETGTGKELVARAVHRHSCRRQGPFIAVNCASLAEGLLESELFGHVRGAFTGAVADKPGLFEAARGGTLFLDEVGDISPALQQRLLRVVQEREIRRVGAVTTQAIDVRIVAATRRNLREEIAAERFREDLFYRLNVFSIALPPLRERTGDIPLLVAAALHRQRPAATDERGAPARLTCSPFAMRTLRSYGWPGNVRELFAVLESAAIRCDENRIETQHLPPELRAAADRGMSRIELRYHPLAPADERSAILAALNETGNRSRAAELLGVGRTTLWRKMKQYGILGPTE
jgi:two-component system, NtrC family, response regulator HydG